MTASLSLSLSNDPWQIAEHATDNGRVAGEDKDQRLVGILITQLLGISAHQKNMREASREVYLHESSNASDINLRVDLRAF